MERIAKRKTQTLVAEALAGVSLPDPLDPPPPGVGDGDGDGGVGLGKFIGLLGLVQELRSPGCGL